VVPTFTKSVLQSKEIGDVETAAQLLLNQVKDAVFPDLLLVLRNNLDP